MLHRELHLRWTHIDAGEERRDSSAVTGDLFTRTSFSVAWVESPRGRVRPWCAISASTITSMVMG